MIAEADICRLASEVGFDACAVVPPTRLDDDARFMDDWIAQGLHGNMDYLERNRPLRYDPRCLVPGARTIVVCLLTYDHAGRDYHRTIKSLLYRLQARIEEEYGASYPELFAPSQHLFCDSAPFLERRWATRAGLGAIGRNHQLIHPTLGSRVHIGELILQVPVEQQNRPTPRTTEDLCAGCTRCLDACPTAALRQPVWDATRCIAYTTHRCPVCQDVCPYNQPLNPAKP